MAKHVRKPTRIPVPGNKIIEEFIGRVHTGTEGLSVAHMIAPPGWSEPYQCPSFDEVTIVIKGRMRVDTNEASFVVAAGETILVEKGERIQYSNPFNEEAEYWAVCVPAFSPDNANREDS